MKISIIIPNYNSKKNLEKNLPHVLKVGAEEVIIVDDGSTDGSVEEVQNLKFKVKNNKSKLKILQNKRNLGFSSAVNQGVKEASGEIVVLLNTDVKPESDFLKPLIKPFFDPNVFAVGCMDKSIEDGKIILRGRGLARWEKGFLIHRRGEVNKKDTFWVSCGSGAFKKDIWLKLGGLDEIYNPFYWEDIDLSYRAQKAGYKILFEPKSKVIHEHYKGIIRQNFNPFYIKVVSYRNQFFFIWKNITDKKYLFSHLTFLPYHFLRSILNKDFAFIFGFLLALLKLPLVLSSRLKVQRIFKKSDREILETFNE